jgi:hypothetical protein
MRSDERRRGYSAASFPSALPRSDPLLLLLEQDSPEPSSPRRSPSPLVTARGVVFFPSPECGAVRRSPVRGRSPVAAELLRAAPPCHLLSYCSERRRPSSSSSSSARSNPFCSCRFLEGRSAIFPPSSDPSQVLAELARTSSPSELHRLELLPRAPLPSPPPELAPLQPLPVDVIPPKLQAPQSALPNRGPGAFAAPPPASVLQPAAEPTVRAGPHASPPSCRPGEAPAPLPLPLLAPVRCARHGRTAVKLR